jgi:hypothetical protein
MKGRALSDKRWYLRTKDGMFVLGLIGSTGEALDADETVIYTAETSFSSLSDDDDIIPLPERFATELCKGVAAELLSMDNKVRADYIAAYEIMKRSHRSRNTKAKMTGSRLRGVRL